MLAIHSTSPISPPGSRDLHLPGVAPVDATAAARNFTWVKDRLHEAHACSSAGLQPPTKQRRDWRQQRAARHYLSCWLRFAGACIQRRLTAISIARNELPAPIPQGLRQHLAAGFGRSHQHCHGVGDLSTSAWRPISQAWRWRPRSVYDWNHKANPLSLFWVSSSACVCNRRLRAVWRTRPGFWCRACAFFTYLIGLTFIAKQKPTTAGLWPLIFLSARFVIRCPNSDRRRWSAESPSA